MFSISKFKTSCELSKKELRDLHSLVHGWSPFMLHALSVLFFARLSHTTARNFVEGDVMNLQIGLPCSVDFEAVKRQKTLGGSITLCASTAGFDMDKQLSSKLKVDKAQLSRWQSGTEGILWQKLDLVMDVCGNDAPVLWQLHQRGYDLNSLRKRESETERENRLLRDQVAALRSVLLSGGVQP